MYFSSIFLLLWKLIRSRGRNLVLGFGKNEASLNEPK